MKPKTHKNDRRKKAEETMSQEECCAKIDRYETHMSAETGMRNTSQRKEILMTNIKGNILETNIRGNTQG